jgi:uncharacterized membrane protein YgcG
MKNTHLTKLAVFSIVAGSLLSVAVVTAMSMIEEADALNKKKQRINSNNQQSAEGGSANGGSGGSGGSGGTGGSSGKNIVINRQCVNGVCG